MVLIWIPNEANESFNGTYEWEIDKKFSQRWFSVIEQNTITSYGPLDHRLVRDVVEVYADGDELAYIRANIGGIRFSKAFPEKEYWYGDDAKYIAGFLPR